MLMFALGVVTGIVVIAVLLVALWLVEEKFDA